MLILTRRLSETLCIGDDITVSVLGIKGNQVRIGISAPDDVAVHREEVYLRIKGETPDAAAVSMAGKTTSEDRLNKSAELAQVNRDLDTRSEGHRKPIITRRKSKLDSSGQIEANGNY